MRRGEVGAGLLALLRTLPGVGWIAGRLAPSLEARRPVPAFAGFALLAVVLLLALAIVSVGAPAAFVSLEVADSVASLFAAAGLCAWLVLMLDVRAQRFAGIDAPQRAVPAPRFAHLVADADRIAPRRSRLRRGRRLVAVLARSIGSEYLCGVAGRVLVLGTLRSACRSSLCRRSSADDPGLRAALDRIRCSPSARISRRNRF